MELLVPPQTILNFYIDGKTDVDSVIFIETVEPGRSIN